MRSQRRRKPYSRESVQRALSHHERHGVLRTVSPPDGGRPSWVVSLPGLNDERVELTTPQAYAMALGLAEAERWWKAELAEALEQVAAEVANLRRSHDQRAVDRLSKLAERRYD